MVGVGVLVVPKEAESPREAAAAAVDAIITDAYLGVIVQVSLIP